MEAEGELAELVTLAQSHDYRDRVVAATGMARLAHLPAATTWLQKLLLDAEDTAVTEAAARALIARGDEHGIRALVAALTEADDNQVDWIESGVGDALGESSQPGSRL